jgi:hypothetical protein
MGGRDQGVAAACLSRVAGSPYRGVHLALSGGNHEAVQESSKPQLTLIWCQFRMATT